MNCVNYQTYLLMLIVTFNICGCTDETACNYDETVPLKMMASLHYGFRGCEHEYIWISIIIIYLQNILLL